MGLNGSPKPIANIHRQVTADQNGGCAAVLWQRLPMPVSTDSAPPSKRRALSTDSSSACLLLVDISIAEA